MNESDKEPANKKSPLPKEYVRDGATESAKLLTKFAIENGLISFEEWRKVSNLK